VAAADVGGDWDGTLSVLKNYGVPLATLALCGVGAVYLAKRMSDLESKVDAGHRRELRHLNDVDVRMIVQQMIREGHLSGPSGLSNAQAAHQPRQAHQAPLTPPMGQQPIYQQTAQQQYPTQVPQVPQPTGQLPEAPQTAWRPSRVTLPPPQEEEVVVATAWHPKSSAAESNVEEQEQEEQAAE
jgi:hypothetical protein